MKRFSIVVKVGNNERLVIIIKDERRPRGGMVRRRKVSQTMARVAEQIAAEFCVPIDRIADPDFYLVDRLTGAPVVRRKRKGG